MFSILKKWNIKQSKSKKYGGQCVIHPTQQTAIIYRWNDKNREPIDYMFHEFLHIALCALNRLDRRKSKEYRFAEEILIQEICKIKIKSNTKKGEKWIE